MANSDVSDALPAEVAQMVEACQKTVKETAAILSALRTESGDNPLVEPMRDLVHGTNQMAMKVSALLQRLAEEKAKAIAALQLSPGNENARRGDLVACVRDRMQAFVSTQGNLETLEADLAQRTQERDEARTLNIHWTIELQQAQARIAELEARLTTLTPSIVRAEPGVFDGECMDDSRLPEGQKDQS